MIFITPLGIRDRTRSYPAFNMACQYRGISSKPDCVVIAEERYNTLNHDDPARVVRVDSFPDFSTQLARDTVLTAHKYAYGENIGKPLAFLLRSENEPDLLPPLKLAYRPPKAPKGSWMAFQQAKKEGRIVVNPRLIWKSEVSDRIIPVPSGPLALDVYNKVNIGPENWPKTPYCSSQEGNHIVDDWAWKLPQSNQQDAYSSDGIYGFITSSSPSTLLHQFPNFGQEVVRMVGLIRDLPMDTGLITSANAEFNSDIYDVLTELAELPETVSFLYSGIKTILTSYMDVKKKIRRIQRDSKLSPAEVLDRVSSLWMGYRYGVMPLVYSVQDALRLLSERSNIFITHRSGERRDIDDSNSSNYWRAQPFQVVDRVWIKGAVDPTVIMRGLKTNVFSTAWELVPLSFVVDWALNVGDLLSGLSTPAGLQQQASSYSRSFKGNIMLVSQHNVPAVVKLEFYELRTLKPADHIGLAWNPQLNWKRKLDALALSWFAFRRLFTRT